MTPRRRAFVLLGLAAVLGLLAASDVHRREAAIGRQLGPLRGVVVARTALPSGALLRASALAVRLVPARYAPAQSFHRASEVLGLHTTTRVPSGTDLVPALVGLSPAGQVAGPALSAGQRVAQLVASGSTAEIRPGGRVDVLVTRDAGAGHGTTSLAVADVLVLTASPVQTDDPGPHVTVQLRVSVHQAVYLAAAQTFARDIRLLARSSADHGTPDGLTVGAGLHPTG